MTHRKNAYIWSLITLLIVVTVIGLIGTTFARYRISSSATLTMNNNYSKNGVWLWASYNDDYDVTEETQETQETQETEESVETGNIQKKFKELQGWTGVDGSTYTLEFLLTNESNDQEPAEFNQNATIGIFATEGVANSSDLTITLSTESETCTASAERVAVGSTIYNAYGPGWLYSFKNNNDPVIWFLKGRCASRISMTLTVTGESVEPASLTLIATGTPAN